MNSFVSPFEDDSDRPRNTNEQRAHEAAAPGRSPDNSAALPAPNRSDNTNDDDGAPPLLVEVPPYYDLALVQQLFKALLDSSISLHLMPFDSFEEVAVEWLEGPLPLAIVANIHALISHAASKITQAPVSRREHLIRLANHLPVSVAAQHGFISCYHLSEDGYYIARVVTLRDRKESFFRLGVPATLLATLLSALSESLHIALFAKDTPSAIACLRALSEGRFLPEIVNLAKATIFMPAATSEDGKASRVQALCNHQAFKTVLSTVQALPDAP